jgi:hypothetical protein
VGEIGDTFQVDDVVFGGLVPWDGVWYWSGVQQKYEDVTDEVIQQIKRDFPLQASQVVYRYCDALAEKARAFVQKHYQQFVDHYGTDLVVYPDGTAMAEDMHKFHQYQFASAPKAEAAIPGQNLSASILTRCIFGFREDKAISFNSLVQNHPFRASKKDLSH